MISNPVVKPVNSNSDSFTFFATTAKGMEPCLQREVEALASHYPEAKISKIASTRAGVAFEGEIKAGYLACIWLRTASRVLLRLKEFDAANPERLYAGVRSIHWTDHLNVAQTLSVDFVASQSQITHNHFGALKTKDAIVDQFSAVKGSRPDVDTKNPDLRVNVYILKDRATLSIDLSGSSLHERGYREELSAAPLKESLAAALLLTTGFLEVFEQGGTLLDPTCGSGTLPIEAARMVCDIAPGMDRKRFGFLGWKKHQPAVWETVQEDAKKRAREGIERARTERKAQFPLTGFDQDGQVIRLATQTIERMGLQGLVHFEKRDLSLAAPLLATTTGVVICNPPYGERLGDEATLKTLYRAIGDLYKQKFKGWKGFVFTGSLPLSKEVGLKADKKHIFFNGAIECRLLEYNLY